MGIGFAEEFADRQRLRDPPDEAGRGVRQIVRGGALPVR